MESLNRGRNRITAILVNPINYTLGDVFEGKEPLTMYRTVSDSKLIEEGHGICF